MKKKLVFWIFLSVILSADEKNLSVYLDEESKNIKEPKVSTFQNKYEKDFNTDVSKFRKVSLMDVVLETVSNSDLLKSAREQVVQSEIKLNDAIAGYYPTLNFESENGRTQLGNKNQDKYLRYYNDRNYKLILNQNLYSGGDTENTIKSLEKKLDLEKNQYQMVLQEEITKAIKAYFDVVFSYRTVQAAESNMKNLNKILNIVKVKYDNGAASIGDLTAINANVSNAQTSLTKLRSKFTESMRYYEYMVGPNYEQTLPYEKNFNINVSTFDLLYERGVRKNSSIIGYNDSISAEKFNLRSNESGFLPKLDFEVSLDNILDKDGYDGREQALNALFRLTFNLYNGGKDKNKILTSYSAIRELSYKLDEEKKKLRWNISKLFTSIQSTNESLTSNISEIISLRKMVDAYWEEFNLGQQDLQALLQGHKQLNTAETELIKFESNNITDFFTLLGYTGDLLAFFDMDPIHPKFIDFSKSDYTQDIYIDDKFLNEKEKLEREADRKKDEELRNLFADKAIKDENINLFTKQFLSTDDEFYTIEIGKFNNQKDALTFIKDKDIDKNSFAYDIAENLLVTSKIAHGIYSDIETAKSESNKISTTYKKDVIIKKVKDVKVHYNEYIAGIKVKAPEPEVKIIEKINTIEKIKQEKKVAEFQFNEKIKNDFINANPDSYTINVTSFNDKKEIEKILLDNPSLYENSFIYNYSNGTPLVRWNYGIYNTYEDAQKAMEFLGDIEAKYYPVVQKISKEQELYNSNIIDEQKVVKEPLKEMEFEYINVTSKTEYKEAIPLKEIKQMEKKSEFIEQKIDDSILKEIKTKPVIKKADPKPIKEKDEEEIKPKPVIKKADPKPIKEKDEEEIKPKPVIKKADSKSIEEIELSIGDR